MSEEVIKLLSSTSRLLSVDIKLNIIMKQFEFGIVFKLNSKQVCAEEVYEEQQTELIKDFSACQVNWVS